MNEVERYKELSFQENLLFYFKCLLTFIQIVTWLQIYLTLPIFYQSSNKCIWSIHWGIVIPVYNSLTIPHKKISVWVVWDLVENFVLKLLKRATVFRSHKGQLSQYHTTLFWDAFQQTLTLLKIKKIPMTLLKPI